MDRSPTITTNGMPQSLSRPETSASQPVTAQNQRFHCLPCARWIATRETDKHLGGKPHRAALDVLERKTQAAEKERRRKLAAAPVAAPTVAPGMAALWACAVCQRAMMKISMAGHLSGAPHARMMQAEKEKEALAVEKERAVAELAEARQRKEEELRVAEEQEDQRQREDELVAKLFRQEVRRLMEIERVAGEKRQAEKQARVKQQKHQEEIAKMEERQREVIREAQRKVKQQQQAEKEVEEARVKEAKHQEEIAKMEERQREVIREAQRKVEQQREQKQQKKKDRKASRRNHGLELATRLKLNGTAAPSPNNGEGVGDGFRSRMIEFLQAQEVVNGEDLDLAPVEPEYQEHTIEHDQTVHTLPPSIPLRLPMFITSITDLPPVLYRVYDTTSVSQYNSKGFTASITSMPYDPVNFRAMVDRHANWNSREGTPFISVTSSPNAARWHINKKESTGLSTTMVSLIDSAALLRVTRVWQMHDAMDFLGLQPSTCERHAYDNEYICAVNIPASTVFACCQPDYYMDMAYVFMKKLERREAAKARPGERVVVTIRAPDSDAAEAVAQGW